MKARSPALAVTVGLARQACRTLPEPDRSDSLAEWSAELYAILDDRDVHPAKRWWRALLYAADLWRGVRRRLSARARARVAMTRSAGVLKTAATGVAVGVPLRALMGANYGGPVVLGVSIEGGVSDGPLMQPGHSLLGGGAFAGWVAFTVGFLAGCLACRIGGGGTLRRPTRWAGFLNRHLAGPVLIATASLCCDTACTVATVVAGLTSQNGAGAPSGLVLLGTSCAGSVFAAWWRRSRRDESAPVGVGPTAWAPRQDAGARG